MMPTSSCRPDKHIKSVYTVGINPGNLWALFSRENVYRLAEMSKEPELPLNGRKNHYHPEYAPLGTGGCTASWIKTLLTIRKLCTASRDAHNVKRIVIIMVVHFCKTKVPCCCKYSWIKYCGSRDSFIENKNSQGKIKKQSNVQQKLFIEHNRSVRLYEKKIVMISLDAVFSVEEDG